MSRRNRKPKIFLDTSVCIDVAKGNVPAEEWRTIWKYIANNFEYAISPMTIREILVGLAKGDAQYFTENREALKVLYPTHRKTFFKLPGEFVLEQVLNWTRSVSGRRPSDLQLQIRVVLGAFSRADLEHSQVVLSETPNIGRGLDLKKVEESINKGKEHFVKRLEFFRAGSMDEPSPSSSVRAWVKSIFGLEADEEECSAIADALDAYNRHHESLFALARKGQYDFSHHDSDWIDGQQLMYLSDPTVRFVVCDGRIKTWTKKSTQSERIILFTEFRKLVAESVGYVKSPFSS